AEHRRPPDRHRRAPLGPDRLRRAPARPEGHVGRGQTAGRVDGGSPLGPQGGRRGEGGIPEGDEGEAVPEPARARREAGRVLGALLVRTARWKNLPKRNSRLYAVPQRWERFLTLVGVMPLSL